MPDLPAPDIGAMLGAGLVRLMRRHRNAVQAEFDAIGLHVGQEALLARLRLRDGVGQAELGRELGIEQPTVAKSVRRLEAGGFVRRAPDPSDGRVSRVWLTDRGRTAHREAGAAWERVEGRMRAGLDEAELAALRRLVDRMAENLG